MFCRANLERGQAVVVHNTGSDFYGVALAGLGEKSAGLNEKESIDECKENIRMGVGAAVRALQEQVPLSG
jgi:hypothetical protein